jgi:hypothetical protein
VEGESIQSGRSVGEVKKRRPNGGGDDEDDVNSSNEDRVVAAAVAAAGCPGGRRHSANGRRPADQIRRYRPVINPTHTYYRQSVPRKIHHLQ